jgi:hypothetical protein
MEKFWIGLMVGRVLSHKDEKAISNELSLMFGDDLHDWKVVCNDQLEATGEYYLFVQCSNYWKHIPDINKSHYVKSIIPSRDNPHKFTEKEISVFLASAKKKEETKNSLVNCDVVLVKDGYLKGLYGIVVKSLPCKKFKIFFSFYVRQFYEVLGISSLEFIGKVPCGDFSQESVKKPLILGANIVYNHKLHRSRCRKS